MTIRPTQSSTFALVQNGLLSNFSKLVDAQGQVSSGKRILRPSDDPAGTSRALTLNNRMDVTLRFMDAIQGGTRELDMAASVLQDAGGAISQARGLVLQALNGSTNAGDRRLLAEQIRQIKDQLLDQANSQASGRYLFGGTAMGGKPFGVGNVQGFSATTYSGNHDQQQVLVGSDLRIAIGLPGSDIFAASDPTGTSFAGLTGASNGLRVDQGSGAATLYVRHDSTTLNVPGGVALVGGGAQDNLIGSHTLSIDPVAGTVTLGAGPAQALPSVGSANYTDFELTNAAGDKVHLDFTAWGGGADNGTVVGAGSMSLDNTNWTVIDGVSTDVELIDASTNTVLHVNVTQIHRAGNELVSFDGTVNLFDTLEAIAVSLENPDGLSSAEQDAQVRLFFGEIDRNHDNVLAALTTLGARSERMKTLESDYGEHGTELATQLSRIEDADYSQVVLDMMRAEQALQLTQSIGSRLLQTSLLDFLR